MRAELTRSCPTEEASSSNLTRDVNPNFRKKIETKFDHCGESVGFFRLSPGTAGALAARADDYVSAGRTDEPYEEAIRDLLLAAPLGRFGYEDVTGLPWVEIDFPEDIVRAQNEILPHISTVE